MDHKVAILLVDDREENLLSLEASIEVDGIEVDAVTSAKDGLRQLLKKDYALVLLDVQMPGMDGFEMARIMRSTKKTMHVPIIFVTAINRDKKYVFEGYSKGAVDYLFKPIETSMLNSKVQVFVDMHRQKLIIENKNRELEEKIGELDQSRKELKSAYKELESFSYMVSHDLKSPIHNINSFLDILKEDDTPDPEESSHIINRVQVLLRRMNELVDNLLSYSRSGYAELNKMPLNLSLLAHESLNTILFKLHTEEHNVKIEDGLNVFGDEYLVRIIILNLLENAIKYSPQNTPIKVGKKTIEGETAYFVCDQGRGIAAEDHEKIFTPFVRLVGDAEVRGTGIGLSSAQKIVHRHGGRLWLESEPGKGSTFYFTLPAE